METNLPLTKIPISNLSAYINSTNKASGQGPERNKLTAQIDEQRQYPHLTILDSACTQLSHTNSGTHQDNTQLKAQGSSWASILQPRVAADVQLKYTKHVRTVDRVKISMIKDLIAKGSKAWDNTLVGYFIGKRLPYSLVKNFTSRL